MTRCARWWAALALFPAALASNWVGVNSFFLHALSDADRASYLDEMSAAGVRVVRIFISTVGAGAKGTSSTYTADVEQAHVGQYDDSILLKIDRLMYEAVQHGVKLDIAMHDRYSLGCWSRDAYVDKYQLPVVADCGKGTNQPTAFYSSAEIQEAFDQRLIHILQHRNALLGNRAWGELSEGILSVAPENEAQGHIDEVDWDWWCRRAKVMRPYVKNGILISTGGSTGLSDGLKEQLYECPELDVVDIHTYDTNVDTIVGSMQQAVTLAQKHGKRVRLQEFGLAAADAQKGQFLAGVMTAVTSKLGVPSMPWELMNPQQDHDFEFWVGGASWAAVRQVAQSSGPGAFDWPGISGKKDWEFCARDSECLDGCCSKQFSDDGQFKCTPGGSQCGGPASKKDWEFCTKDSECLDGCCSKQFSDDGQFKCTPGGTQCGGPTVSLSATFV